MLRIVHHNGYRVSLSRTGSSQESKYAALIDLLVQSKLKHSIDLYEPEMIAVEAINLVHDLTYVQQVLGLSLEPAALRRIGFAATEQLHIRPRLGSGGTLLTAKLALEHGIACNTAGGSHHAHAGFGSGFCVFNDVAIAAASLKHTGAIKTAMIIDLDVHQGDGTASIFANDPDVFTFSMHCEKNFPFRKSMGNLDIGLAQETTDHEYLAKLREILPDILDQHLPDIVFYNAGVDPHINDKLGHLALTDEGLRTREQIVLQSVTTRSIPIAIVMGGGYGDDRFEVACRHLMVFEEAVKCV